MKTIFSLAVALAALASQSVMGQGSDENDLFFWDGVETSVDRTETNAYSGESIQIQGSYLTSETIYDGMGGDADQMFATSDNDYLSLFNQSGALALISIERFFLGLGNDFLNLSSQSSAYGDVAVVASGGDDIVWAGAGDDLLNGGQGDDIIDGGPGDDVIIGEHENDTIFGGDGNDEINPGLGNNTSFGQNGDDLFNFSSAGQDIAYGGPGNDEFRDIVNGELFGEAGNDFFYCQPFSDGYAFKANGGDGDDFIAIEQTGAGISVLSGNAGNDQFAVFDTQTVVLGGPGADTVMYGIKFNPDADIFLFDYAADLTDFELIDEDAINDFLVAGSYDVTASDLGMTSAYFFRFDRGVFNQVTTMLVDTSVEYILLPGEVIPEDFQLVPLISLLPDPPPDSDADGIADAADNCIEVANTDQRDSNMDGYGNFCDADLNDDGIVNTVDLGLFRSLFFSDDENADFDGDGAVNTIDLGILRIGFFLPPGPSGVAP